MSISCQILSLFIHDFCDCFIPLHENDLKWMSAYSAAHLQRSVNEMHPKGLADNHMIRLCFCRAWTCAPCCTFQTYSVLQQARCVYSFLFPINDFVWWDCPPEKNNSITCFSKSLKIFAICHLFTFKWRRRKSGDVIIERQSPCREEGGFDDGCYSDTKDSNTIDRFLLRVNVASLFFKAWQQSFHIWVFCNHGD